MLVKHNELVILKEEGIRAFIAYRNDRLPVLSRKVIIPGKSEFVVEVAPAHAHHIWLALLDNRLLGCRVGGGSGLGDDCFF